MTTKAVTCKTQRSLILNPTFLRLRTSMGLGKVTPTCHICCCVISFSSVLPHNVCFCWICKLPNVPGAFHQPFSARFHPFPRIFIHFPPITNLPGVFHQSFSTHFHPYPSIFIHFPPITNLPSFFHQPFSKQLLTDLTLIFSCSQI